MWKFLQKVKETYQLMGREEYSPIQDRKCTTVMDRYKGEMQ